MIRLQHQFTICCYDENLNGVMQAYLQLEHVSKIKQYGVLSTSPLPLPFNIPKQCFKNQVAGLCPHWESHRNFKNCVPSLMCFPHSWESSNLRGAKQWSGASSSIGMVLLFLFCVTLCCSDGGTLLHPQLTGDSHGNDRVSLNAAKYQLTLNCQV